MATVKKITADQLAKARKGGRLPKQPKMPKSKTVKSLEAYTVRWNAWVDKVIAIGNSPKAKAKQKLASLKEQIAKRK